MTAQDDDCHYGDHSYHGGGICVRCGRQLRCYCGVFIREDGIEAHLATCRTAAAAEQAEYDSLNSYLLSEASA